MFKRFSHRVGLLAGALVWTGACFAQSAAEQVILAGTALGSGFFIGVSSSENRTDWLSTEGTTDFVMAYPSGQAWGSVFITFGPAVASSPPGKDMTAYQTLVLELSGDPGTTIDVGIKDSSQPNTGGEIKKTLTLSGVFQTYMIPLASFTGANLSKVYVLTEFVFGGSHSQTVRVRSVKYTSASSTSVKVLPQIAFGGGWYSAIYFANTGNAAVSFQAGFFADDGTPLTVAAVGAPSKTLSLGPGSTAIIEIPNAGTNTEGYASAALPPEVIGYGVFRWSTPGNPDQEAVVPFSGNTATVSTLVWDDTKYSTAIAVLNPSSVNGTVAIAVRNESGLAIGNPSISLAPGAKKTFMLRDLPGLSAVTGARGSADFVATAGAVAVLGLRANGTAITSIPTSDK